MVRSIRDGSRFQVKTFGMAVVAGSLLVTGCSMNPFITKSEIEQPKSLVVSSWNEKSHVKPESDTDHDSDSVSVASHKIDASGIKKTESVKLVDAVEQLYPTPLEPIEAPAAKRSTCIDWWNDPAGSGIDSSG